MAENRNFTAQELFNQLSFTKLIIFSHLASSLWDLLKVLVCYAISRKLMTSFSHQKRLKSKIQKQTIVGNAKFYYRAKFQLKQLKISLKEITSWWQLTCHATRASTVPKTGSSYPMAARMQTHHLRQLHTL